MSAKSGKNDRIYSANELIDNVYAKIVSKYPIRSIEDPFDQDDFEAYATMTKKLGDKI